LHDIILALTRHAIEQAIRGSASKVVSGCPFRGLFKVWAQFNILLVSLSECCHGVILQLRIYALYDASPRIGALIVSAFSLEVLAVVGMFGFGSAEVTGTFSLARVIYTDIQIAEFSVVAEAVGVMVRCNVTAVPAWLWVLWVPVTRYASQPFCANLP
jgi:hypothetical protein